MNKFIVTDGFWAVVPVGDGYNLKDMNIKVLSKKAHKTFNEAEIFMNKIMTKYNFSADFFQIKEI